MGASKQHSTWRRVALWLGILGILSFVGYGAYVYYNKYRQIVDEERKEQLRTATLADSSISLSAEKDAVWPQWRGPKRDGISTETEFLTEWPKEGLKILWQQPVGKGYSSLAVANGRVTTMMQDGDHEAVVCWDAETGKEVWRHRYPAEFKNNYGDGPRATPTVDGNRIYTVGATGIMHCLEADPKSNQVKVRWQKDLLYEYDAQKPRWGVSFSPLVLGDVVYTHPGGQGSSLVALNKYNGQEVWKALSDRPGYSSPIAATLAGKKQIIFFSGEAVNGVDPATGERFWHYPWTTDYDANIATPIVAGDYVFISSGYDKGCGVLKIEATGSGGLNVHPVYTNHDMRNHFPSCVFFQDHLYGFDEKKNLTCMEFRSGNVRWQGGKTVFRDNGALLLANGHLIVLGGDGILAIGKASPEGFQPISKMRVSEETPCWVMPVLANGLLYVRDKSRLVCLDMRKPKAEPTTTQTP